MFETSEEKPFEEKKKAMEFCAISSENMPIFQAGMYVHVGKLLVQNGQFQLLV